MQRRTDLAMEAVEELAGLQDVSEEDISVRTKEENGAKLTYLHIRSAKGAEQLQKPQGTYITLEVPPLSDNDRQLEEHAVMLGEELRQMLPDSGAVLVVGLGNESITPDALGPRTAKLVLATRHIGGEFARSTGLDNLRSAAVFATGVLGRTGVESMETVRGICSVVQPVAVIAVDAMAARSLGRLGRTVQLSDGGIAPGSGVGNNRRALSREQLGVPVVGMGVPTIVDVRTLAADLMETEEVPPSVTPGGALMMVTPQEIDLIINRASRLVAMTINSALQPDYSPLELITVAE